MQSESFTRLFVVVLLFIFMLSIALSGFTISYALVDNKLILLHQVSATLFLLLVSLHLFLRRKKLKKMVLEFLEVYQNKSKDTNHDYTLKSLKNRQVQEICKTLAIDQQEFQKILAKRNIVLKSQTDSVEETALYNNYNAFKITSILLELFIQSKTDKE